jgi:hypothetical protein
LLVTGPSSSGKSFVTERLLAIDYAVSTAKVDRFYAKALRKAGLPPSRENGMYSIAKEAVKLRNGTYPEDRVERFFQIYSKLVRKHLQAAADMGVSAVLEGYTLSFPDEAEVVRRLAGKVGGRKASVVRVSLAPSLDEWNRNRAGRKRRVVRTNTVADGELYERAMRAPEPVTGVVDMRVERAEEVETIADSVLPRHKWHQRFTLGPVSTRGPSDSHDKFEVIQPADIEGKRVVDLCCATGVIAIMSKAAGASEVAGIELNPRHYCKGLELQKVLARNTELDPIIDLRLGDVREVLPTLGMFDTGVLFGALHYFDDYAGMLGLMASAVDGAAYVEFNFAEAEHDTASAPDGVQAYVRKSGNTIYMANRPSVERLIEEAMPGFVVEDRRPISAPGRKLVSQREIWRLRRS